MNITSVTTSDDGSPQPAAGQWPLTSPVGPPPLRFFRQVASLRFETGGMADRIRIDPEATTLEAVFRPYDYDALDPSEPSLEASLATSGGAVIVTLDAPRQVRQVRLSSDAVFDPVYSLGFHRLDGEALADKPTVTIEVQGIDLLEARFAIGRRERIKRAPGDAGVATLPSDVDFTDVRFAIRREGSASPSLRAADLAGLQIRGYPTGPRLGLADPSDPDSAVFFWQASGEIGKTAPADQGNVDAGEVLAAALERYVDDFLARSAEDEGGYHPPQSVEVALIMASDAPCILDVETFHVTYHLVQRSLPSREDKQVLRFPGDRITTRELPVRLPGQATVTSATLETVESFSRDRPLASGDGVPGATPAQKEGVYVGVERWVAQAVTPPRAISVSGIAVALMAISNDPEVLVEIQEDWRGGPSGRKLAAGEIVLGQAGRRGWATLLFPEEVVLPSTPHWILVKVASGRAVWLADAASDTPVRVLEGANMQAESSVLDGLQTLYRLFSRGEQAQEQQPASLAIEDRLVAAMGEQDGTRAYDLTSTLNDYLDGLPASTAAATVPLTFTAALPGFITVYPPVIEYTLDEPV